MLAAAPEGTSSLERITAQMGTDAKHVRQDVEPFLFNQGFVQIRTGPFDVDLIFAPDGIESFEDAKKRSTLVDGKFPVAALRDIIASKKAANRQKDRESLPRLEAFAEYLKTRGA